MHDGEFPDDIYTEQEDTDPDTLRNLGPLRPMAGIWEGQGKDEHPFAEGTEEDAYLEHAELQPIDAQPNGPQLLYGLRYHVRIVKPGEVETFHDQVGYWLWEPATKMVTLMLAIPRAQVALATARVEPDAREFELFAPERSIVSGPFLQHAFRTTEYRIRVTIDPGGTWSYDQDTVMQVLGRDQPFHHRDRNTLKKIDEPTPNPLMR